MAKRPKRGRPPGKKKTKGASKPRGRRTATKNGPQSQALPGMGQYMNERLNHFCESLYRTRQKVNKLKQDEKGDLQGAQEEMLRPGSGGKGKTCEIYVYAGIRLRIKPGVAKISCELVDETGVAEGPREPKRGRSRRGEEDTQVDATSAEPSAAASEDEDEETGESD